MLFVILIFTSFLAITVSTPETTKRTLEEYCSGFRNNYRTFCGDSQSHNLTGDIGRVTFCWNYDNECMRERRFDSIAKISNETSSQEKSAESLSDFEDFNDGPAAAQKVLDEAKNRRIWEKAVPCTEKCNVAVYPHCTTTCKCDYSYPSVQRFCNPPPLPLFLNTCRLWYWKCPKYEQYHYASQFIYSKAEKGKVLPGQVGNPNPFGIAPGAFNSAPANSRRSGTDTRTPNHEAATNQLIPF